MEENSFDLPQDLWTQIFEQLDEQDLEDLSLVSKQFLSITNPLKRSLKILDKTIPSLPVILRRFPYLESITFCVKYRNSYAEILRQISHLRLHGEGMRNLKRLSFGGNNCLEYHDFTVIADLFQWLEEISFPRSVSLKDCEFQKLQLKLTSLKKVIFGGWNNNQFPSNESLISLSLNCLNLEEIDMEHCFLHSTSISEDAIGFIMRHSPKLTTLRLPYIRKSHHKATMFIQNSIAYAKNLHTYFSYSNSISEQVLRSFVTANPPLQRFEINYHSYTGMIDSSNLLLLFRACSSIHHLSLPRNNWLSDSCVKTISQVLTKLTHIDLSHCSHLTTKSFFILTQKCPFLEEIEMVDTRIGASAVCLTDLQTHTKIRYLNLNRNIHLNDKTLGKILLVCPVLQSIDISRCSGLTDEGVGEILKTCGLLTKLTFVNLLVNVSNIFGKYFEGRTIGLKNLEAGYTKMNDKTLGEIGKICPRLEFLGIAYCEGVTDIGVIEVVKNCKKLKKIDTRRVCPKLEIDILGDKLRSISKGLKFYGVQG